MQNVIKKHNNKKDKDVDQLSWNILSSEALISLNDPTFGRALHPTNMFECQAVKCRRVQMIYRIVQHLTQIFAQNLTQNLTQHSTVRIHTHPQQCPVRCSDDPTFRLTFHLVQRAMEILGAFLPRANFALYQKISMLKDPTRWSNDPIFRPTSKSGECWIICWILEIGPKM